MVWLYRIKFHYAHKFNELSLFVEYIHRCVIWSASVPDTNQIFYNQFSLIQFVPWPFRQQHVTCRYQFGILTFREQRALDGRTGQPIGERPKQSPLMPKSITGRKNNICIYVEVGEWDFFFSTKGYIRIWVYTNTHRIKEYLNQLYGSRYCGKRFSSMHRKFVLLFHSNRIKWCKLNGSSACTKSIETHKHIQTV